MIEYRIDKISHAKASGQIKDMVAVLDEIAPSFQVLQSLLAEHEQAISTPAIDAYRDRIQEILNNSISLARRVAEQTKQLCSVSDQASKHLVAIDEHFGAVLREGRETSVNPVNRTHARVG